MSTNDTPQPFSLRIFLPDGTPDGVRILEKSNWTGCGVYFPRSVFPVAKKRDEFGRTGVYILVGQSDDQALPTVYIGQGDVVRGRLESHYSNKDFWTWAVFFTSKDEHLNSAHVKHLEARLIQLATEAKRAKLDNGVSPQLPHLTEADTADVESFLSEILNILPLVGLTVFEKPLKRTSKKGLLSLTRKGAVATGYEVPGGFVVQQGSQANVEEVQSIHPYQKSLRKDLVTQGVLELDGKYYRFTQDYTFSSPSTAAAVVVAGNANGRTEWKDSGGKTLKEIQEATMPSSRNREREGKG